MAPSGAPVPRQLAKWFDSSFAGPELVPTDRLDSTCELNTPSASSSPPLLCLGEKKRYFKHRIRLRVQANRGASSGSSSSSTAFSTGNGSPYTLDNVILVEDVASGDLRWDRKIVDAVKPIVYAVPAGR